MLIFFNIYTYSRFIVILKMNVSKLYYNKFNAGKINEGKKSSGNSVASEREFP